jgi:hypothetical protein
LLVVAEQFHGHDSAEPRDEDRAFLAGADAAFIVQNVYLHCASAGLAVVVRALIDRGALAPA